MPEISLQIPGLTEQQLPERVGVRLLGPDEEDRTRYRELMEPHHYLKSDVMVGEQLRYVAEVDGQWLALLSWSAAARHLKDREQWLGWSDTQRRRRLALLANNARFLILPGVDCLAIMVMATLAGVVRGQRDLASFAAGLTQPQLRALGSYRKRDGRYDFPKETTFQRVLAQVEAEALEKVLFQWEDRMLGRSSRQADPLVAIDGKAQRGSTPHVEDEQKAQLVSAQSLPSGRVLGTVAVELKSNEWSGATWTGANATCPARGAPGGAHQIPAARQLLDKIGPLDGKVVMLDALHTCQETLRKIHQENGADYLLPVKGNHEVLESLAAASLPPPDPGAEPSGAKSSGTKPTVAPQPTEAIQPPAELSPLRTKHHDSAPTPVAAVHYRRQRGH